MEPSPGRGNGAPTTAASPPPLRRRLSMEEDYFYQQLMAGPRRPSQPPPYAAVPGPRQEPTAAERAAAVKQDEKLPEYTCSVQCEGVFEQKMEIENTTKRAEDRNWHTRFVSLRGTALNVYSVKKDWGWGRSRDGPTISPDNPPWIRKSKLDKSYSLLYADAGIAADYRKRRYVIRVRAETDQFLLSCVELSTFVKWLECLFAAIDVAAPIEDRDFPRDQSVPRIQRIRWFQGYVPAPTNVPPSPPVQAASASPTPRPMPQLRSVASSFAVLGSSSRRGSGAMSVRRSSSSASRRGSSAGMTQYSTRSPRRGSLASEASWTSADVAPLEEDEASSSVPPPPQINPINRLSVSSYPNEAVDEWTGKWTPEHQWSSVHDMLYAKLCFSLLFFKSPRKSNYIIMKGKQWFVDWATGRMVRVLPPAYGEVELFGPWQVIHTENRRI